MHINPHSLPQLTIFVDHEIRCIQSCSLYVILKLLIEVFQLSATSAAIATCYILFLLNYNNYLFQKTVDYSGYNVVTILTLCTITACLAINTCPFHEIALHFVP